MQKQRMKKPEKSKWINKSAHRKEYFEMSLYLQFLHTISSFQVKILPTVKARIIHECIPSPRPVGST